MMGGYTSETKLLQDMLAFERKKYREKIGAKRKRDQLPCDAPIKPTKSVERNTWIIVMDTVRQHGKLTSLALAPILKMSKHEAGNYMRMLANEGRLDREQIKNVRLQKDGTHRTTTLWEYTLAKKYL